MASPSTSRLGHLLAWLILLSGTGYLSWRWNTSAAFEHPIYFSLSALIWCATASNGFTIWKAGRRKPLRTLLGALLRWPSWRLLVLVVVLVGRTLLFHLSSQLPQCAFSGVYSFAPIIIAIFDAVLPTQPAPYEAVPSTDEALDVLPGAMPLSRLKDFDDAGDKTKSGPGRPSRGLIVLYSTVAILWAFTAQNTLASMRHSTGAICPSYHGWAVLVPTSQLLMVICDALIMLPVARMRRRSNDTNSDGGASWAFVGSLSLFSAGALMFVVLMIRIDNRGPFSAFTWAPAVQEVIMRDLFYDGLVAAAVLISATDLLASTHPATIAAIVGASSIYFAYMRQLRDERNVLFTGRRGGLFSRVGTVIAILCLFFLVRFDVRLSRSSQPRASGGNRQVWLSLCYVGFLGALLVNQYIAASTLVPRLPAIIKNAQRESNLWIKEAHYSTSVQDAAREYRLRYDIPPPPGFDKWYAFAVKVNATIIDSYDQINNDLLPYWGISPAMLRNQTTHLLEQTKLGIGGFRIQKGEVKLSPLTPGTHFWMMTGFEEMIAPFLQHLPDMDLAFNIDDECRVSVPFTEAKSVKDAAQLARKRVPATGLKSFSSELNPPWGDSYWGEGWAESHADSMSPYFSFRTKNAIFDEYIASTCPPTSAALTSRWWSRSVALPAGRGAVVDPAAAVDLCQRIDIPRMHGFLLDPGAFAITRTFFPLFSQSRIPGFSDILVPSPWNFKSKVEYEEDADIPWAQKANTVFWRGSSSDGLSTHGGWTGFLRSRFVHLAQVFAQRQQSGNSAATAAAAAVRSAVGSSIGSTVASLSSGRSNSRPFTRPSADVSFVGNFTKCWRPDCLAQTQAFYGAPEVAKPPEGTDFQVHWRHQHLVDLDGAGFSGRFLPFLKSRSLVYRASLFRTWYDERVHAWRHFVPLDIALGDIWGLAGRLGRPPPAPGSAENSNRKDWREADSAGGAAEAVSMGETIATEGRDWAMRALRKEDMQVYMFRLLLEWARLIDDRREELGYE